MFNLTDLEIIQAIADGLKDDIQFSPTSPLCKLMNTDKLIDPKLEGAELLAHFNKSGLHELSQDSLSSELAAVVNTGVGVIKNKCLTLIDTIHDDVEVRLGRLPTASRTLTVNMRKIPEYLDSDYVVDIADRFKHSSRAKVDLPYGRFPRLSADEVLNVISAGVSDSVFQSILEVINGYEYSIVEVYDYHFRREEIVLPAQHVRMAPAQLPFSTLETVVVYHIAKGFLDVPSEQVNLKSDEYNNCLTWLMNNMGIRYESLVTKTKRMREDTNVVVDVSNDEAGKELLITLDKAAFDARKESVELVIGECLQRLGLVRGSIDGQAAYDEYHAKEQLAYSELNVKAAQKAVLIEIANFIQSRDFLEEFYINDGRYSKDAFRDEVQANARKAVGAYNGSKVLNTYDMVMYVVAGTLYSKLNALPFLTSMNRAMEIDQSITDGREASTSAVRDQIVKWSVAQTVTQ